MIIRLSKEQKSSLIEETRKKHPKEACGILFGDLESEGPIVRKVVPVHNVLESTTNFRIDAEGFLRSLSEAEREGMELIGFFHSHPAAAHPSVTDAKYMKLWPENIWLVISSINHDIAAFRIVDGKPRRIEIRVDHLELLTSYCTQQDGQDFQSDEITRY
jgi:proteasome lid subunit RPN8/RPN11